MSIALLLIGVTFVGAIALGISARRGHDMRLEEWSVGGRGFGALFIFLLMAGEIYTTFTLLGGSGWAYGKGAPAFYIICYGALAYVMSYWLLPPVWKYATTHRIISQAHFWAHRYGSRGLGGLVALVGVVAMVPYLVLQLKGLGIIVSEASYGAVGPTAAALIGTVGLVCYVTVSGIHGSARTALLKDVMILVVVVALGIWLPVMLHGGIGEMFSRIETLHPELLVLPERGLSASWFASTVVLTALGFYLWPHTFGSVFASRSAEALRRNATFMPLYQLVLLFVFFTGFAALLSVPGLEGADVDLALLRVVREVLPPWVVGTVGAAGVLTALVPGSMILMAASTMLADTGYRALHPDADEARVARVAKWCVPAVALVALWYTLRGGSTIVALLLMGYAFVTQLFPSLVLGLFAGRTRVGPVAAGAGIVAGVGTVAAITLSGSSVASLAPWLPAAAQDLNVGVIALFVNVVVTGLAALVERRVAVPAVGVAASMLMLATMSSPSAARAQAVSAAPAASASAPAALVIPAPVSVVRGAGAWAPADTIIVGVSSAAAGAGPAGAPPASADLPALAKLAAAIASGALGVVAIPDGGARGDIRLHLDPSAGGGREAYRLEIGTDGVEITAGAPAGIFYGLQTLRQLLGAAPRVMDVRAVGETSAATPSPWVDAVTIEDAPRFGYRGLHLDVSRHFRDVAFVKRYIDLMARFKLNRFHWHLTDDQGWRIEIRKYPRLTGVGGCRDETMVARNFDPYVGDGTPHCGFYTQEEIREVVAYAAERYVTIVPEIEMPGHAVAALAAYPELACTPGPFEVRTTWGVDENIFCPSERTFAFLEDVLTEVIALFPGRYVHIGGDEAPKKRWEESTLAQEVIRREGLKDEHELQSYFVRRIERFLASHDRRLIGWDEILEGGLAPQATVMSWRGESGGIAAAKMGHDVIMTPNSHLYLDYYQGDARHEPLAIGGLVPLEKVYAYEPIPAALTPEEGRHVLGAQGNVWTEYLKTDDAVEYMAYPRALALAEITWSPREVRDWDDFLSRLPNALRQLDALGVNYRLPHVQGLEGDRLTLAASVTLRLRTALPDAVIRYTLDGSDPTTASPLYDASRPLTLSTDTAGVRVTARAFTPTGKASPPRSAMIRRATLRDAVNAPAGALRTGLRAEYYAASIQRASQIDALPAGRVGLSTSVELPAAPLPEQYALRLSGLMRVPTDGVYEFALVSDDGSTMHVDDELVVDNDGLHGAEERRGMVALRAGLHRVTVRFFQGGGGAALSLRVRIGDGEWMPVPSSWWHFKVGEQ